MLFLKESKVKKMAVNPNSCGFNAAISANDAACPGIMQNFCSTDDVGGRTYLEKWQGDNTTSECRGFTRFNASNPNRYIPTTNAAIQRYLVTDGNSVTFPQQGSLIYDPSVEDMIDMCQDNSGACDNTLDNYCEGFTRQDLSENPNLAKFCGCFLSDAEYDKYTGSFGVEPICDPVCVIQSAVKPQNPLEPATTQRCNQTVCVIDDVTINVLGQTTTGDINFAQACAACSNAGCTCSISDISITAVESVVGNINFDQNCGGPPTCYQRDENGVPQEVECSLLEGGAIAAGQDRTTSPTSIFSNFNLLVIIGIVIAVVIIITVGVIIFSSRKNTGPIYPQSPAPVYLLSSK